MRPSFNTSYLKLLGAITSSNLGNGILLAAFPLIATSTTQNPVAISGIVAVAGLPWLFVGPIAGTVADRHDRRRLMVAIDIARATAMGLLALYIGLDGRALLVLYAVVLLVGLGETFVDTSGQSLVPRVVAAQDLDRANGRLLAAQTIAQRFIGPMLGGVLFALGAWIPVAIDAATFLLAALIVATLPSHYGPSSSRSEYAQGLWKETIRGLRWIWDERTIRAFTIGGAALHFVRAAVEGILVLVAAQRLGLGSMGFAGLLAATGIGYVLGTELASRVVSLLPRDIVGVGSVALVGVSFIVIGITTNGVIASIFLVIVGLGSGFWSVISLSYRHGAAPDDLLGRVLAGHLFAAHGAVPVGALIGGLSASMFGLQSTFFLGACLAAALAVYLKSALSGVELDPSKLIEQQGL